MWFFILLGVLVAAFVIYRWRVPILAKVLGQPEQRVDRHLNGPGK